MGLDQCTKCKEYICQTTEYDLSNAIFDNPFFPKVEESIEVGENQKNFFNFNNNTNNNTNNNLVIQSKEDLIKEREEKEKREKEEREEKEREEKERKEREERERKEKEEREEKERKEKEEREEKERLIKIKNEMLEKEKEDRKKKDDSYNNLNMGMISDENKKEKIKNEKINKLLENMCIYGSITKEEIKEEKKNNPEKFIETSEALQKENDDPNLFALGLLSTNLQSMGIETAIEKSEEDNSDEQDAGTTCLQFIVNGLAKKKKYDLHFELGKERNEELLNDENEFEKFKNDLKRKLSKDYHISEDKIIVTFPQKGSFRVQVIFQSEEFNDLDEEEFTDNFKNDEEFKELANLKEIHSEVIMGGCKLSKNQLDSKGNRVEGWGEGELRGGKPYNPPLGWIGIGLKVLDKYENNDWIGYENNKGEWCVAYHGVARDLGSDKVKDITGKIIKGGFKKGSGQVHKDCDDIYNPGNKVGEGVYCTPNIETAAEYCGGSNINGKTYKTVLMVRVKPSAIRQCQCFDDYWVVNGTTDEIRPYRILYKVL